MFVGTAFCLYRNDVLATVAVNAYYISSISF